MSTIQTTISGDRDCDHCGYNLKGLPADSKCPECGTPIRRLSSQTSGTIMDEAPTRFVKMLRLGFGLASLSILCTLFFRIFGNSSPIPEIAFSSLWALGVFVFTTKRPRTEGMRPDRVLDHDKLRLAIRLLNLAWPLRALCTAALLAVTSAPNGGNQILAGTLTVLGVAVAIVSWLSMIPTSVYMAEIAYWSSHENLAYRLRGCAWILAVVGTLASAMTGTGLLLGWPLLVGMTFLPWLLVALTVLVFNLTFLQMAHAMHWVIKNQIHAAGSFERMEERRKKEEQYKGRIVDDTPCDYCGYNLIGLMPGSGCPECGTLVSSPTRPIIRDPATTPSYHNNDPLEVSAGEDQGVYFNDQLDASGHPKAASVPYTPDTEVPDEGDIPLAMDEADEHTGTIHHDGDANPLNPRSFDDEP